MRKMMWFAVGFGAGCAFASYFWLGDLAFAVGAAGIVLAVTAGLVLRRRRIGAYLVLILMGIGLGFGWSGCYDRIYTAPARALDGETVNASAYITGASWETEYGSAVDGRIEIENRSYQIRVYLDDDMELTPGDSIHLAMKLRLTTDGGANEPTYHRSNGILLLGYQRDSAELEVERGEPGFVTGIVWELRRMVDGVITENFPEDTAAFAKALVLGDRTGIDYKTSSDLKVSGISHVIAVSGLHVSILFALVYLVTMKRRYLTALVGIPVVVLFMALTGFTPSVVRAGLMQIIMMLAMVLNQEYDSPSALSFSVVVMLVANPLVSTSIGFQLSAGSMAGIFLFSEKLREWLTARLAKGKGLRSRAGNWIASGVSVSLAAQLVTTPLVAVYFGTVSLVSIVTNLAVVWVISFIFYGVMLASLAGCVYAAAGRAAAWLVSCLIRYVLNAAGFFARLPLAAVYTCSVYIVIWLIFSYCLIFALVTRRLKRPLVALCCCVLALCAAVGASWLENAVYEHCVTVLDVGQGQSVILQSRGKTFVVDCGGDDDEDAADITAQKLLSMGISRIDGLILTHYDRDHAGGAAYLLERIRADAVYLPVTVDTEQIVPSLLAAADDAQIIWVEEDLRISSGDMNITLYAPESATAGNESCIAVLFQTEKCDTLITGDMSQFRERQILARTQLPELEVLVVGHHGSKTSTSEELLAAASPEVAIISVGEDNSYGHPAQEVLERLARAGCEIFRTDVSGDIVFRR